MTTSRDDHKCGGCCPGPIGSQGPQGPQGLQGVAGVQGQPGLSGPVGPLGPMGPIGPSGHDGLQGSQGIPGLNGLNGADGAPGPRGADGAVGPQGPQGQPGQNGNVGPAGPQGPQGTQGPQGIPGDCVECPCHCDEPEFAESFSQVPQDLDPSPGANLPGGIVLLEKMVVSTTNIDSSQAATTGKFIINKAGWYDVATGMTGTLNPIPAPLPVWTLSLFLNGAIIPGTTFSNVPLSPAQASNEITSDAFIYFNVGDVLTLANTSTAQVFLSAPTLGTNAQTNSAYLKILLLRAGAK